MESRLQPAARANVKSAEDSRTPRPRGNGGTHSVATASWSAAVFCRFRFRCPLFVSLMLAFLEIEFLYQRLRKEDEDSSRHQRILSLLQNRRVGRYGRRFGEKSGQSRPPRWSR